MVKNQLTIVEITRLESRSFGIFSILQSFNLNIKAVFVRKYLLIIVKIHHHKYDYPKFSFFFFSFFYGYWRMQVIADSFVNLRRNQGKVIILSGRKFLHADHYAALGSDYFQKMSTLHRHRITLP